MLTKIPDFGHFIMLEGAGRNEFRFLAFSKYFSLLAAGFCPKKISICPKNYRFARLRGTADCSLLSPLARTPMLILEMVMQRK